MDLPVAGKRVKIYIHEVILSYSRKKYYVSSLKLTTQDIIRAIVKAIEYFSGVPEELIIDNPKQMVIIHKKNGTVQYNDEFLRFCGLYGIQPNACHIRGLVVKDIGEFDRLLAELQCKDT